MAEAPNSPVSPDEARDLADQVLSGRAYVEASRPPSLQERAFNWISDRIGDLINALSSSGGRGVTAWIVIALFTAVILFLLWRFTQGRGELPKRQARSKPTIDVLAGFSAAEWLEQAEAAEAAGDWRLALRCRHRSLAATLVGQGLVVDRPGQTAGEIYRSVAKARPATDVAMREATNLFKDTWYGWVEADRSSRDRFVELSEQVLRAAEQEPERAEAGGGAT